MDIQAFSQYIEASRARFSSLVAQAQESNLPQPNIVNVALQELHQALEELQLTQEELCQQNEFLRDNYTLVEVERERYQNLFNQAPDGQLVTDRRGTIRIANQAAAALLGVNSTFLVGKPLSLYIAQPNRSSFLKHLADLSHAESPHCWSGSLAPRHGKSVPVELRATSLREGIEQAVALHWTIHDISTYKALERERALLQLKSRFIAMVSYELRAPLTTIMSAAALLENGSSGSVLAPTPAQLTAQIQTTVTDTIKLIDEMLWVERLEVTQPEAQPDVRLDEICDRLVKDLQQRDGNQHLIELHIQTDETNALPVYDVNKKLLRTILNHLLTNALRYSPINSSVRLSVFCHEGLVIFEIKDRGIGIPVDELPYIFEPFYRATNVENVEGSGLGLFIAKQFVTLYGGTIAIASQVGDGTTVTVALPLRHVS
jgi:two-component system, OmpR family, sensor histidine kinase VicK